MARKQRFSRFSRKRRIRSTWFPILGTNWVSGGDNWFDAAINIANGPIGVSRAAGPSTDIFPITRDFTLPEDGSTTQTLRDSVEGQTYLLQRIVGKIHLQIQSNTDDLVEAWPYVQVGAGFFIARQDDEAPNQPDLFVPEYDPMQVDNIANPWIWRRTWILRNPGATTEGVGALDWPAANSGYGSVIDGPHIDAKVKRKIVREHRLWFAISSIGYNFGDIGPPNTGVVTPSTKGILDVRVLGRMTKGRNISTF